MEMETDKHLMINVPLMKITGLYQILNPNSKTFFGFNIFKCIVVIEIILFIIINIWDMLIVYYCRQDIYAQTNFLYLVQCGILTIGKQYYLIKYSDKIWKCIQLTSINYLTYKYHRRQILENGRSKTKLYVTLFCFMWMSVGVAWILAPIFLKNYYMEIKIKNELYHYRYNVLNFIFPVSDKFYNDHFLMYFTFETCITIMWSHGALIFDIFLISMCTIFSYQLMTITNSYSNIGISPERSTKNGENSKELEESKLLDNFKILIQDQQKIIENMRTVYKIFKPITLLQLFSDSFNTILLLSAILMNCFNGVELISPINLRFMVTIITQLMHLFIFCYLFTNVDEQKESLNFGLYSSDWTAKSICFKKLLLYSMKMNSADYLKLQFSRGRIVNFEMFSSIIRTMYSILSVTSKMYSEKM